LPNDNSATPPARSCKPFRRFQTESSRKENKNMKLLLQITLSVVLSAGTLFAQSGQGVHELSFHELEIDVHGGSHGNPGAHALNGEHGGNSGSNHQIVAPQPLTPLQQVQANLVALSNRVAAIKQEQNQLLELRSGYIAQGLGQAWQNKMDELQHELYVVRDEQVREMAVQRDLIDAARRDYERQQQERQQSIQRDQQLQRNASRADHACAKC
jgi:hypothetical protein